MADLEQSDLRPLPQDDDRQYFVHPNGQVFSVPSQHADIVKGAMPEAKPIQMAQNQSPKLVNTNDKSYPVDTSTKFNANPTPVQQESSAQYRTRYPTPPGVSKDFAKKYDDGDYREYFDTLVHELSHYWIANKYGLGPTRMKVGTWPGDGGQVQFDTRTAASPELYEADEAGQAGEGWLQSGLEHQDWRNERMPGTTRIDRANSMQYGNSDLLQLPAARQRAIFELQRPEVKNRILHAAETLADQMSTLGWSTSGGDAKGVGMSLRDGMFRNEVREISNDRINDLLGIPNNPSVKHTGGLVAHQEPSSVAQNRDYPLTPAGKELASTSPDVHPGVVDLYKHQYTELPSVEPKKLIKPDYLQRLLNSPAYTGFDFDHSTPKSAQQRYQLNNKTIKEIDARLAKLDKDTYASNSTPQQDWSSQEPAPDNNGGGHLPTQAADNYHGGEIAQLQDLRRRMVEENGKLAPLIHVPPTKPTIKANPETGSYTIGIHPTYIEPAPDTSGLHTALPQLSSVQPEPPVTQSAAVGSMVIGRPLPLPVNMATEEPTAKASPQEERPPVRVASPIERQRQMVGEEPTPAPVRAPSKFEVPEAPAISAPLTQEQAPLAERTQPREDAVQPDMIMGPLAAAIPPVDVQQAERERKKKQFGRGKAK